MKELLAKIGKEKIVAAALALAAAVGFLNKDSLKKEFCGEAEAPAVIEQGK